jgi:serine/threonine protein kinase
MESLSNSPEIPLINIKKSAIDESSVGLSHGKSDPITEVAIRSIRNIAPEEHSLKASLTEHVVHLNAQEHEGAMVRIGVQIHDLARALQSHPEEIEKAIDEGQLEQMIAKSLKEKEEIKQDIRSHLPEYGLTPEEFKEIDAFYTKNQELLSMLGSHPQPIVIRKGEEIPYLGSAPAPRSLAYIPEGQRKGMYVLLMDKGVDEVGVGSIQQATLCICLDTGKKAIIRSAHWDDVTADELEANKIVSKHPEYFASGTPIEHVGDYRPREWEKEKSRDHIPKLLDQPKISFMMDYFEGGALNSHLRNVSGATKGESGRLTEQDQWRIACEYAVSIAKLHELGLVLLDPKPENILMTHDMHARTADFGHTVKEGTPITWGSGTPGFIAPELYHLIISGKTTPATFSADIWGVGSVLSELTHGLSWYNWITQHLDETEKEIIIDLKAMEVEKGNLFPERDNEKHPDAIINRCLQEDPNSRPSAKEVADALISIYDSKYGEGSFNASQRKPHE